MSKIFVFAASKSEADPLARLLGVSRRDTSDHAGLITAGPNHLEFFITGMGPKQATERAVHILSCGRDPRSEGEQPREVADVAIVIGLCRSLGEASVSPEFSTPEVLEAFGKLHVACPTVMPLPSGT